jgi:hypothetical protein
LSTVEKISEVKPQLEHQPDLESEKRIIQSEKRKANSEEQPAKIEEKIANSE